MIRERAEPRECSARERDRVRLGVHVGQVEVVRVAEEVGDDGIVGRLRLLLLRRGKSSTRGHRGALRGGRADHTRGRREGRDTYRFILRTLGTERYEELNHFFRDAV